MLMIELGDIKTLDYTISMLVDTSLLFTYSIQNGDCKIFFKFSLSQE